MAELVLLSPANIELAYRTVDAVFRDSPQVRFDSLNRATGADLVIKVETLNPIRCFKGRGTDFFVEQLEDDTPLVAASAGNFGQGLAYASRKRGLALTVFAAENANPLKLDRMRHFGAKVILAGHDFDAAKDAARHHASQAGERFVEDGREPALAEGAGTIALELLRRARFDVVVVPVGNGALINGIGAWVKDRSPATRVIGVCAGNAPAMERSWRNTKMRSGEIETTSRADTIADGIAVRVPVPEAIEDMRSTVDDIVLVGENTIVRAMRLLLLETGLLPEPSGAVGLAALLAHRQMFVGLRVATILCGSNITEQQFGTWFSPLQ